MRKSVKFLTDRTGMVFESLGLVVVSTVAFSSTLAVRMSSKSGNNRLVQMQTKWLQLFVRDQSPHCTAAACSVLLGLAFRTRAGAAILATTHMWEARRESFGGVQVQSRRRDVTANGKRRQPLLPPHRTKGGAPEKTSQILLAKRREGFRSCTAFASASTPWQGTPQHHSAGYAADQAHRAGSQFLE